MKGRITTRAIAAALMFFAGYAALFIAPDEATMHQIQRIFYFHLGVLDGHVHRAFISLWSRTSPGWLRASLNGTGWEWPRSKWAWSSCTAGLATGVLWGKPAWGIWWTWDARLTTAFILWLLYISYLLLRGLIEEPQRRATLSAVFGIFAFLDAPLVYASNRLWRTQHPSPVIFGGPDSGLDPTMGKVLVICIAAVLFVAIIALVDRYRLERMRHEWDELRVAADARDTGAESALIASSAKDSI